MANHDPYTVPDIPVDDMNNAFYSYQNKWPQTLPLAWIAPGDTRERYDLRLLPEEELNALGWVRCDSQDPPYEMLTDPENQTLIWDSEIGNWTVRDIPQQQ